MLEISGKSVVLREFTTENLYDPAYYQWLRDIDVITTIYRIDYLLPLAFSEVEDYVKTVLSSKNDCFFAIYDKETDHFIGTQRIGHIDWRTGRGDMGILIGDKNFWGKGVARDAITTASTYAFRSLSLRKLTAGTPSINIAMCKCFERIGYKEEGRLREQLLINGEYCDHVLYGLLRSEFSH